MENINYNKNSTNWIGFFLTHAIPIKEMDWDNFDGENIQVEMKVNGVECNFISVVEKIGEKFNETVDKAVKDQLLEKANDKLFDNLNEIAELAESLRRTMTEKIEELD